MPDPRTVKRGGSNPPKLSCRISPGMCCNVSRSPAPAPGASTGATRVLPESTVGGPSRGVVTVIPGSSYTPSSSVTLSGPETPAAGEQNKLVPRDKKTIEENVFRTRARTLSSNFSFRKENEHKHPGHSTAIGQHRITLFNSRVITRSVSADRPDAVCNARAGGGAPFLPGAYPDNRRRAS